MIKQRSPDKTIVILGECKDRGHKNENGGDGGTINTKDIENLRRVADAFPSDRFETFVLLAKLCPFTAQEIESAKTLNDKYRYRAILLTARELEPYHIYDRKRREHEIRRHAGSAEGLALTTTDLYFKEPQN